MIPTKHKIKTLVDDLFEEHGLKAKLVEELDVTKSTMTKWTSPNYESNGPFYGYLVFMRGLRRRSPEVFNQLDTEAERILQSLRTPPNKPRKMLTDDELRELVTVIDLLNTNIRHMWAHRKPAHEIRAEAARLAARVTELQEALDAADSHAGVGAGEGSG